MFAVSWVACQGWDLTEKSRISKIRGAEPLAKNSLDSLILKDISTAYTPSLPTFIWAHPAPLYRSRLQRSSSNSNSAAYKIGNHVSLRSSREWRSLGKKLETFREIVYFSFFFLFSGHHSESQEILSASWEKIGFLKSWKARNPCEQCRSYKTGSLKINYVTSGT